VSIGHLVRFYSTPFVFLTDTFTGKVLEFKWFAATHVFLTLIPILRPFSSSLFVPRL
jgi:hypothetical protein